MCSNNHFDNFYRWTGRLVAIALGLAVLVAAHGHGVPVSEKKENGLGVLLDSWVNMTVDEFLKQHPDAVEVNKTVATGVPEHHVYETGKKAVKWARHVFELRKKSGYFQYEIMAKEPALAYKAKIVDILGNGYGLVPAHPSQKRLFDIYWRFNDNANMVNCRASQLDDGRYEVALFVHDYNYARNGRPGTIEVFKGERGFRYLVKDADGKTVAMPLPNLHWNSRDDVMRVIGELKATLNQGKVIDVKDPTK